MLSYDLRVKMDVPFDYCRIYDVPQDHVVDSFTRMIWYGYDEEGPSVYRQNPHTMEMLRIDFQKN